MVACSFRFLWSTVLWLLDYMWLDTTLGVIYIDNLVIWARHFHLCCFRPTFTCGDEVFTLVEWIYGQPLKAPVYALCDSLYKLPIKPNFTWLMRLDPHSTLPIITQIIYTNPNLLMFFTLNVWNMLWLEETKMINGITLDEVSLDIFH